MSPTHVPTEAPFRSLIVGTTSTTMTTAEDNDAPNVSDNNKSDISDYGYALTFGGLLCCLFLLFVVLFIHVRRRKKMQKYNLNVTETQMMNKENVDISQMIAVTDTEAVTPGSGMNGDEGNNADNTELYAMPSNTQKGSDGGGGRGEHVTDGGGIDGEALPISNENEDEDDLLYIEQGSTAGGSKGGDDGDNDGDSDSDVVEHDQMYIKPESTAR